MGCNNCKNQNKIVENPSKKEQSVGFDYDNFSNGKNPQNIYQEEKKEIEIIYHKEERKEIHLEKDEKNWANDKAVLF